MARRRRPTAANRQGAGFLVGLVVVVLLACLGVATRTASPTAPPVRSASSLQGGQKAPTATPAPRSTAPATPPTPIASPSPPPAPPTGEATVTANLRSEPRIALDTVIGKLCAGDQLAYRSVQQVADETWYRVRVTAVGAACSAAQADVGAEGWVAASVVSAPSADVRRYALSAGLELPTAIPAPTAAARPTQRPQTLAPQTTYRVGAICRDGTRSSATGRGACSHHGGVDHWLYGP